MPANETGISCSTVTGSLSSPKDPSTMFTRGAYLLAGSNLQAGGWLTMEVSGRDAMSLELNLKKVNPKVEVRKRQEKLFEPVCLVAEPNVLMQAGSPTSGLQLYHDHLSNPHSP